MNKKQPFTMLKVFNFFLYGSISILLSFFPLYFQEVGLSQVAIGMLMAGGPFVSIFANPFWGYWSDRLQDIRRVLIVMLIGNVIIVQFVFQLQSLTYVFMAMLVFFMFQTPLLSQSNSMILNAVEGTAHKFGSIRAWGSLGWALLAVAASPLIDLIGIEQLWVLYTILLLITIICSFKLPRSKATKRTKLTREDYKRAFFGNKYFMLFVLLGILISVPNSMNQTFFSLYIDQLGGSVVLIGWAAFLTAIFEAPVFLLLDRFLKKDLKTMMGCLIAVSSLYLLRWILMASATSPLEIMFYQMLHCVTFGGYYYIGTVLTAMLIPSQLRASGQAVYALTWGGVSGIIAGFLGGWLFQELGPRTMYTFSAVLTVFGVVGFTLMWWRLRKVEKYEDRKEVSSR
ncbi:MFS transporter [Shouchella shacheensis]|uniref:MFS transporter n=1 Tax=Shouchella shacheensis TaxID=1649580 RepID=UPI0009E82DB5|nr:MFS transporter [Shouchella shacheensis]